MIERSDDDLTRREVLRTATGVGTAAAVGLGATGNASATVVDGDATFDADLRTVVERETEDLRSRLSDLGYLPEESVDQFDLAADVEGAISATADEVGSRAVASADGDPLVSISHNTAAADMALFVKPAAGDAHAVVDADGGEKLVTADGTYEQTSSDCEIIRSCYFDQCDCEEELQNPERSESPLVPEEWVHREIGYLVHRKCCWSGTRSLCYELATEDCNSCRGEMQPGRC